MSRNILKSGAIDYITKEKLDINKEWKLKESYTLFAVITCGYVEHIVETKYIKKIA